MSAPPTVFASLSNYVKGEMQLIDDDARHYACSNIYEVAANSAPYEKVVVAKHGRYVIETLRAEGTSSWFAAAHDEFALVMDGQVEIDLVKLDDANAIVSPQSQGSVRLGSAPDGNKMGWLRLRRGHQALLPPGAAYRFRTSQGPGVIVLQTVLGPCSVEKWREICPS